MASPSAMSQAGPSAGGEGRDPDAVSLPPVRLGSPAVATGAGIGAAEPDSGDGEISPDHVKWSELSEDTSK